MKDKSRDHFHIEGENRGAAQAHCNRSEKQKIQLFLPLVLHVITNYKEIAFQKIK